MKIWVSTDALTGRDAPLLWRGAFYCLQRLLQLDHTLSFDLKKLSPVRQKLLENENITPGSFSKEDADLRIKVEASALKAVSAENTSIATAKEWITLSDRICFPSREAEKHRKTAETDISISLNLDGTGESNISTGLNFFDHMLQQIAKHGLIDLYISCEGDLEIDEHHTIEDVAITLGETIIQALGNKIGIERYGFLLPMDESIASVAVDLSGRPYLVFDAEFKREYVGDFPNEMVKHFFYSLAMHLQATLHISVEGENDHHKVEACFKGFARCLRAAISRSERTANILPSTKNLL